MEKTTSCLSQGIIRKGHSVAQQWGLPITSGFSCVCKCTTWILKTIWFASFFPPSLPSRWPNTSFSPERSLKRCIFFLSLLPLLNWHCSKICLVSCKSKNPCWKKLQLHLQWSTGGKVTRATERYSAAGCFEKRGQEKLAPKEFITVVSGLSWDSVKSNIKEIWRNLSCVFLNTQIDTGCKVCERHILHWSTQTGVLSHT